MRHRVLSALAFGPLALLAAWTGGWPLLAVVGLVVALGYRELVTLLGRRDIRVIPWVAGPGLVVLVTAAQWADGEVWAAALVLVMVAPLLVQVTRPGTYSLTDSAFTTLACAYLGGLGGYLLRLRQLGDAWLLLLALLLTWAYDSGAYFSGRAWGRRKLAPSLSAGKTWEGTAGGLAVCMLVAGLLAGPARLTLGVGLGAGAVAAVLTQLGDLAESAIKRYAQVKDAGSIIPGHGGVLDRCDGLLLAAFGLYVYFRVVLG